jgi:outer membrane protein TolC
VRVDYEAQAARSLADIDVAHERLLVERERHRILRDEVQPSAAAALDLARRALDAGSSDALQFLDLLRLDREIRVETLEAEQAVYAAWCRLEQACGAPLLLFPEDEEKGVQ